MDIARAIDQDRTMPPVARLIARLRRSARAASSRLLARIDPLSAGYRRAGEGRLPSAERFLRLATVLSPRRAVAHCARGNVLIGLGRPGAAVRAYRSALHLAPDLSEARYGLGTALLSSNQYAEAAEALAGFVRDHPGFLPAYSGLGSAHHLAGDLERAVEVWAAGMAVQRQLADRAGHGQAVRYLGGVWTGAIGHIALLDFFAKARALGVGSAERHVVLAEGGAANAAYLDCWREHFEIVSDADGIAARAGEARLLEEYPTVLFADGAWRWAHHALAIIEERWEAAGGGALLRLRHDQIEDGRRAMAPLGLPRDAWFVTLHVRELPAGQRERDIRVGRNADVLDYRDAIRRITDAGGWVVRIGEREVTPLPAMDRVIDYAHCAEQRDWLDVFLIAQCRFFVGTNSGPVWAAKTFGVPALLTNWSPLGVQTHASNAIMLPRLIRPPRDGALLSFAAQLAPPFDYCETPQQVRAHGGIPVDNAPADLAEAVDEMLQRSAGRFAPPPGDAERQRRFRHLADRAGAVGRGRIAAAFLAKHAHLLDDEAGGRARRPLRSEASWRIGRAAD